MRYFLFVVCALPLILPSNAFSRKPVSFQLSAGVLPVYNIRTDDRLGYSLAAGVGLAVSRTIDVTWDVGYAYFPTGEDRWVWNVGSGGFATYEKTEPVQAFDTSVGVRVAPWRDLRVGGSYLVVGGGVTWLARGMPGTDSVQGDEIVDPFVALGFGLAGALTDDTYLFFELVAKTHLSGDEDLYALYPIRVGLRF